MATSCYPACVLYHSSPARDASGANLPPSLLEPPSASLCARGKKKKKKMWTPYLISIRDMTWEDLAAIYIAHSDGRRPGRISSIPLTPLPHMASRTFLPQERSLQLRLHAPTHSPLFPQSLTGALVPLFTSVTVSLQQ